MKSILKTLAFLVIVVAGSTTMACTASPKVIDGTVYAEYPKADILGSVQSRYRIAKVICTEDGKVRLLMVFDRTGFGIESARILKEGKEGGDVKIGGVSCGKELVELQRLAEIGRQYDKKPSQ